MRLLSVKVVKLLSQKSQHRLCYRIPEYRFFRYALLLQNLSLFYIIHQHKPHTLCIFSLYKEFICLYSARKVSSSSNSGRLKLIWIIFASCIFSSIYFLNDSKSFDFPHRLTPVMTFISGVPITLIIFSIQEFLGMSLIISISLLMFDEIILLCLLAIFNIFSFLANRSMALKKQHRTFDYPMLCNLSANLGLNIACYKTK